MLRFCLLDIRYVFNKKSLINFLITVFIFVFIFNAIYNRIFINIGDESYGKSIKQLEYQYYKYVEGRYNYNPKIMDTVLYLDPVIVMSSNFFQVIVGIFMFIWFHSLISREMESGVYSRNVVLIGKVKYLFVRLFNSAVIIVPALMLMEFFTIMINSNRFIPVNMDKQWPVIFRTVISNGFYFLMVLVFVTLVSLFSGNERKSFRTAVLLVFVNFIVLHSFIKYLSPFYFRDWMFHNNIQIFFTQLGVYIFSMVVTVSGSAYFYKRQNLLAKQEKLKW